VAEREEREIDAKQMPRDKKERKRKTNRKKQTKNDRKLNE
jgi:hypothetical protein